MTATKEILQKYYDYFNHKNIQGLLELLSENVVHDLNQGASEVGKTAFAQFMDNMRCYDEQIDNLSILVSDDGTRASAEFIVTGRYLETDTSGKFPEAKGQLYKIACGSFFQLDSGKISRVTVYYNVQEWLRQITG